MASTKKAGAKAVDTSIYLVEKGTKLAITFVLAVTGSSTWTNQDMINNKLNQKLKAQLAKNNANILLYTCGQAEGADKMITEWASQHDSVTVIARTPDFQRHGKVAVSRRNWSLVMTDGMKQVIAFDANPGESWMISDLARSAGKNDIKFEAFTE